MRPLTSLLHRSGVYSYLKRSWRSDDSELRAALQAELDRKLAEVTATLGSTIKELRKRQGDLRHEIKLLNVVLNANNERLFERHPQAMDLDAVTVHASRAIAAARLQPTPMPHLLVENILPEATYRALLDATPPDECFSDRDVIKQNFRPAEAKLAPAFTAAMWTFLERDVIARVLAPALMDRFHDDVARIYQQRYGECAAAVFSLPHEPTAGRLMLRRPGYHLEPHLDPRRVIVTCLIYFARPSDDSSFGTQLFSVDGLGDIDQSKTFYPRQSGYQCTLEKTVPFTPNTAVAFLNAGSAAHGATIPASAPEATKRYAYQFYISPDPEVLSAITGETG